MPWQNAAISRSPEELIACLRYYQQVREKSPLPEGWAEDLSQLEMAANGESDANASITAIRKNGGDALHVNLAFDIPNCLDAEFRDNSGEGLTPSEMFDILKLLIGLDLSLDNVDEHCRNTILDGEATQDTRAKGTWTNNVNVEWDAPESASNF